MLKGKVNIPKISNRNMVKKQQKKKSQKEEERKKSKYQVGSAGRVRKQKSRQNTANKLLLSFLYIILNAHLVKF